MALHQKRYVTRCFAGRDIRCRSAAARPGDDLNRCREHAVPRICAPATSAAAACMGRTCRESKDIM